MSLIDYEDHVEEYPERGDNLNGYEPSAHSAAVYHKIEGDIKPELNAFPDIPESQPTLYEDPILSARKILASVPRTLTAFRRQYFMLKEEAKYNGINFEAFIDDMETNLKSEAYYTQLIKPTFVPPSPSDPLFPNHVEMNRRLHNIICENVNRNARSIIQNDDQDGIRAWNKFKSFYGAKDVGAMLNAWTEYGNLKWDGGSKESFNDFVGEKQRLREKVQRFNFKEEDDRYALELLRSINISHFPHESRINYQDPNSIDPYYLIDCIRSMLSLNDFKQNQSSKPQTALLSKPELAPSKTTSSTKATANNKERLCNYCVKNKYDKANTHDEKFCGRKKRDEFEAMKKQVQELQSQMQKKPERMHLAVADDGYFFGDGNVQVGLIVAMHDVGEEEKAFVARAKDEDCSSWVLDTGCSISMTNDSSLLSDLTNERTPVIIGNGKAMMSPSHGTFTYSIGKKPVTLRKVLFVPDLVANLLSVNTLLDHENCHISGNKKLGIDIAFKDEQKEDVLIKAHFKDGLWRTQLKNSTIVAQ